MGAWSGYLRGAGDLGFVEHVCLTLLSGLTLALGLCAHGITQALIAQAWAYHLRNGRIDSILLYEGLG